MKTTATVTGPNKNKVKLTFGIYGLKNFCKRLGCEPHIQSILSAFTGGTRLEAMTEIIRSGIEQQAADSGETVHCTDYEACEVMETATATEAEHAMKAFLSSIVGEDYDEWFKRLTKEHDKAVTKEKKNTEAEEAEKKSTQPDHGTK